MFLEFSNKKISGILTIVPKREVSFDDEMARYNFSPAKSMKLKQLMGYEKHCIVEDNVCSSDLCEYGLNYLFEKKLLKKDDIDALILVTQTPDQIMPPTSNILQGKLGLKKDMLCLDISQGCAGYIIGLFQAFMLLEQKSINKVILLNADVLSPKVSQQDRNSYPLMGDGASVTIVEKGHDSEPIHGFIKMDGEGAFALQIPAGGARMPTGEQTGILHEDENGNFRALDHLVMKGDAVFNFMQTEVPPMIEDILLQAGLSKDEVDYFMFHQPNKFMLEKLADKLAISYEKMPNNVVANFGNASGVTIPTNICFNLGEKLCHNQFKMCLAGFGVGLTWGAIIMSIGKLNFNEIIRF